MAGNRHLRIGDIVARTGLSERAVRHYEAKKLIAPARSDSGQRLYGADDLMRLARVALLRRAGFGLDDIAAMMGAPADAKTIVAAHLETLRANREAIADTIEKLEIVAGRLDAGAPADAALICEILEIAERSHDGARWRAILSRYFSNDEAADWMAMRAELQKRVDPEQHDRDWIDLINRIKAALPMDPRSVAAQAFLAEWDALLAPFRAVASEEQQRRAAAMWSDAGAWAGQVNHPMTGAVADFIKETRAMRDRQRTEGDNNHDDSD